MLDLDAYLAEDLAQRAPRPGRGAPCAQHQHPLREPRSAPGPARVAGAGGPRAKARRRASRRLLLRAEHAPRLRAARARRRGGPDLARVRFGAPPGVTRPRSHLVLRRSGRRRELARGRRLRAWGRSWTRFPSARARSTIRRGGASASCGGPGTRRCRACTRASGWTSTPSRPTRCRPWTSRWSSWWASTHPRSPFVAGLIVASHCGDGTRLSLSDWDGLVADRANPDGSPREGAGPRGDPGRAVRALRPERLRRRARAAGSSAPFDADAFGHGDHRHGRRLQQVAADHPERAVQPRVGL